MLLCKYCNIDNFWVSQYITIMVILLSPNSYWWKPIIKILDMPLRLAISDIWSILTPWGLSTLTHSLLCPTLPHLWQWAERNEQWAELLPLWPHLIQAIHSLLLCEHFRRLLWYSLRESLYFINILLLTLHFDPVPTEIVQRYCFYTKNSKERLYMWQPSYVSELLPFCNFGMALRDHLMCGINDKVIQCCLLIETTVALNKLVF